MCAASDVCRDYLVAELLCCAQGIYASAVIDTVLGYYYTVDSSRAEPVLCNLY